MSERQTPDADTKRRVVDALTERVREELAATQAKVDSEQAASELDPEDVVRADDQSQADDAGDLKPLLERSASRQQEILDAIEALDFSETDTARPGAVIGFDGDRYVLGVVADAFEVDGITYEGIAPDAPVAAAVDGLSAGDSFPIGTRTVRLDFVI
ncbi:hypothetical protein BHE97_01765 [Aeromicrobium sp. PE09-221]|uniref:hypothetical protein n=1 Tax=Aeromicrobium sp. PE09-221 TaxID=1898043 RepID=UPI000B3E5B59|nr:hypothetical protein [Aeromicrobium sp. PE09-221]OUZ12462.1 hypothetical protein BHE97_01765 [Aeromicrobium sp. PE09-221]